MSTSEGAPALAVTGSTGWLGGLVARGLEELRVAQRLLVRDLARAPQLEGATVLQSRYGDSTANAEALDGVSTLFMVSAAEHEKRLEEHRAFIDAAAGAGVGPDGVIRGPAGDGRAAVVSHEDIARVAVAVVVEPVRHAGETYSLTGPEALTLSEAARLLTEVRGREVRFQDETVEEAYRSREVYGAPDWQVEAWVSTYLAIKAGELDGVTDDVERVTRRRPLSLRDYLAASESSSS